MGACGITGRHPSSPRETIESMATEAEQLYNWIPIANEARERLDLPVGTIEEAMATLQTAFGASYPASLIPSDHGPDTRVVHQEVKARGSEVGERVVHALDESIERRDVAGLQLQSNGLRSRVFHRGNDRLRVRAMRVIREDRVDATLREALNRTAANTTTATGDNRNLLWGNCIRFHRHFALHSGLTGLSSQSLSRSKKSSYHAPQSLEALFAVLLCMGRILSHEIYRRLRDRVHDRDDETHWGLTHRAAGANVFEQSCDACHRLVGRRAGLRRDLVRDAELCQRSSLLGVGHGPPHPVLPQVPKLLARFCACGKVLRSGRRHLNFQFKIELIEEVRFGFEVSEKRSIRNASLFRDASCRRAQALRNDNPRRRLQNRASLLIAPRP